MSKYKFRRDSAANWTAANPILADGELGYDKTNKKIKIGDGSTTWNSLPNAVGDGGIPGAVGPSGPVGSNAEMYHTLFSGEATIVGQIAALNSDGLTTKVHNRTNITGSFGSAEGSSFKNATEVVLFCTLLLESVQKIVVFFHQGDGEGGNGVKYIVGSITENAGVESISFGTTRSLSSVYIWRIRKSIDACQISGSKIALMVSGGAGLDSNIKNLYIGDIVGDEIIFGAGVAFPDTVDMSIAYDSINAKLIIARHTMPAYSPANYDTQCGYYLADISGNTLTVGGFNVIDTFTNHTYNFNRESFFIEVSFNPNRTDDQIVIFAMNFRGDLRGISGKYSADAITVDKVHSKDTGATYIPPRHLNVHHTDQGVIYLVTSFQDNNNIAESMSGNYYINIMMIYDVLANSDWSVYPKPISYDTISRGHLLPTSEAHLMVTGSDGYYPRFSTCLLGERLCISNHNQGYSSNVIDGMYYNSKNRVCIFSYGPTASEYSDTSKSLYLEGVYSLSRDKQMKGSIIAANTAQNKIFTFVTAKVTGDEVTSNVYYNILSISESISNIDDFIGIFVEDSHDSVNNVAMTGDIILNSIDYLLLPSNTFLSKKYVYIEKHGVPLYSSTKITNPDFVLIATGVSNSTLQVVGGDK